MVAGKVDAHQVGGGDLALADDRALGDRADGAQVLARVKELLEQPLSLAL